MTRLTYAELDAIIGVAGDACAAETLSTEPDPEAALEAFESGMDKLRAQLAKRAAWRREKGRWRAELDPPPARG